MSAVASLAVEPMTRAHLREVLTIDALVYPRPWSASLFKQELASPDRVHLVAIADEAVVGHAGLMLLHDEGHVSTVAVHPDHQRGGIARRLMIALTRAAIERDMASLTLEVRTSNRAAQELYRAFGFVPAGVRRNYYTDGDEDALVMWAVDIQSVPYRERLAAIEAAVEPEERR